VSGCVGFDLCSFAVAQQLLLPQQPGLHAFWAGALVRMHDRLEPGTAVTGMATASKTAMAVLFSTAVTS
jgi:hypothetical protein